MQSTQHRFREHDQTLANAITRFSSVERNTLYRRVGHARPQRHVRARSVVMRSPVFKDGTQMRL